MKKFIDRLRQNNAIILDTETTGLDNRAEILQIGIASLDGEELFNSLVRPGKAKRWPEAMRVHGISWSDVQDAPTISDLSEELKKVMEGKLVAIYNADFDTRLLQQSISIGGAASHYEWLNDNDWQCVMKAYAQYYGQRNTRYGGYRWQSLTKACQQQRVRVSNAHDALGDAKLTAALIRAIEQKLT